MAKKPIIGITSSTNRANWGQVINLDLTYATAISRNGGIPVVLPLADKEAYMEAVKMCDGLLFSGGEDINPLHYGVEPHKNLGKPHAIRDEFEIEAMKYAHENDIPTLAICRGMQVMNVALGGTLYQDVPSEVKDSIQHTQKSENFGDDIHYVELVEGSVAFEVMNKMKKVLVNSFHHQAVKQLAPGLVISGKASDGVVEAIEDPTKTYFLGVQWHPEESAREEINELFKRLVMAPELKKMKKEVVSVTKEG